MPTGPESNLIYVDDGSPGGSWILDPNYVPPEAYVPPTVPSTDLSGLDYQALANASGIPIVDYKNSVVKVGDIANKYIQKRVVNKSYDFPLVQLLPIATRVGDTLLQAAAYPFAIISFPANRIANKLQIGDYFKFSYALYGIVDMVCFVTDIDEGDLSSETISIIAREAIEYLSNQTPINSLVIGSVGSRQPPVGGIVSLVLTFNTVLEAPYVLSGDTISIYPIASREGSTITAEYSVYGSIDGGISYNYVGKGNSFAPHGSLVAEYTSDTYEIDDQVGFELLSYDVDMSLINIITRNELFTNKNLAILGDELISFQYISPHETLPGRYIISGIIRGRYDTQIQTHPIGTDFYFLGATRTITFSDLNIVTGANLYFKLVPNTGSISDAIAVIVPIEGRAYKPYAPINLMANDMLYAPTYTSDIALDWDTRIRGTGAGYGLANVVTDAAETWEGLFEIQVLVSSIVVRTVLDIDAATWTYTSAMNTSDNGVLADAVVFKLSNYRIVDNYKYSSAQVTLSVVKE